MLLVFLISSPKLLPFTKTSFGPTSSIWDSPFTGSQWNYSPTRQFSLNYYSYASFIPIRLGAPRFKGLPTGPVSQYSTVRQTLLITRSVYNQSSKGHNEIKGPASSNITFFS